MSPLCGRDWSTMALSIPTRTGIQIRTHAQKYLDATKKGKDFPQAPYQSKADHPSPIYASSSITAHPQTVSVKPIVAQTKMLFMVRS